MWVYCHAYDHDHLASLYCYRTIICVTVDHLYTTHVTEDYQSSICIYTLREVYVSFNAASHVHTSI